MTVAVWVSSSTDTALTLPQKEKYFLISALEVVGETPLAVMLYDMLCVVCVCVEVRKCLVEEGAFARRGKAYIDKDRLRVEGLVWCRNKFSCNVRFFIRFAAWHVLGVSKGWFGELRGGCSNDKTIVEP